MPLAARLALIGASILAAAALAFAIPLPGDLQAQPQTVKGPTPAGTCGCTMHDHQSHHA